MKSTMSLTKTSVSFCCRKLYSEICERELPRIRLLFEQSGSIRPAILNKTIFKFCPFCGELVRTTLILANKKVKTSPL